MRKSCPLLCVDPMDKGNEARFINDQWAPPGMPHACANVRAALAWDRVQAIPHLIITATRTIYPGEELLLDYGENYWKYIHPRIMEQHAQYYHDTLRRIETLRLGAVARQQNREPASRKRTKQTKRAPTTLRVARKGFPTKLVRRGT